MKAKTILVCILIYSIWLSSFPENIPLSHAEENHRKSGQEIEHSGHDEHPKDTINLSKEQISEFGLVIQKAGPGVLEKYVETPGAVVVNEETISHISARFPGIVKQVLKRIGDSVKKDESLAVIESSESLTPYTIRSLIAGTVIAKHATLGELLKDDDIAYTIADLSSVWINLSIYQTDIPRIEIGQIVRISQGHEQREAEGTISYISPVIDEDTRTATARVVLANSNSTWMPGLFVTGKIRTASTNVPLLIPTTAVHQIEDKPTVFVRTKNGFMPTVVALGESNDMHVEVVEGLKAGEEYVTKHSFALKAELAKSSFGDGHNH